MDARATESFYVPSDGPKDRFVPPPGRMPRLHLISICCAESCLNAHFRAALGSGAKRGPNGVNGRRRLWTSTDDEPDQLTS